MQPLHFIQTASCASASALLCALRGRSVASAGRLRSRFLSNQSNRPPDLEKKSAHHYQKQAPSLRVPLRAGPPASRWTSASYVRGARRRRRPPSRRAPQSIKMLTGRCRRRRLSLGRCRRPSTRTCPARSLRHSGSPSRPPTRRRSSPRTPLRPLRLRQRRVARCSPSCASPRPRPPLPSR